VWKLKKTLVKAKGKAKKQVKMASRATPSSGKLAAKAVVATKVSKDAVSAMHAAKRKLKSLKRLTTSDAQDKIHLKMLIHAASVNYKAKAKIVAHEQRRN